MTDKQIKLVGKRVRAEAVAYFDAVDMWRAEDPELRKFLFPHPQELIAYLFNRVKKTRMIAKAAIKEIRTNGGSWYPVKEDRLKLWERHL